MQSNTLYDRLENGNKLPKKNISINFNDVSNKKDRVCTKKCLYTFMECLFLFINSSILGIGGYNVSGYISIQSYDLAFYFLLSSLIIGLVNIIYFIHLIRRDPLDTNICVTLTYYALLILDLIFNCCIFGKFYNGSITMQSISIIYICLVIFIDILKLLYLVCSVQKKYKIFPKPVDGILNNDALITNTRHKKQRVAEII